MVKRTLRNIGRVKLNREMLLDVTYASAAACVERSSLTTEFLKESMTFEVNPDTSSADLCPLGSMASLYTMVDDNCQQTYFAGCIFICVFSSRYIMLNFSLSICFHF